MYVFKLQGADPDLRDRTHLVAGPMAWAVVFAAARFACGLWYLTDSLGPA